MKTKIFVATCLAFSVISSSCSDFLTEDPKGQMVQNNYFSSLLSGENSLKQLLLTNNQLVTRLIKFFD